MFVLRNQRLTRIQYKGTDQNYSDQSDKYQYKNTLTRDIYTVLLNINFP